MPKPTYEELLDGLEAIMNDSEGWLDESIEMPPNDLLTGFANHCRKLLTQAERKLTITTEE